MKGKRLLAASLVVCLCLCACSARGNNVQIESADSPSQNTEYSQESSVDEAPGTAPHELPNGWKLSDFIIAGFDKDGPGDFGYRVTLDERQLSRLAVLLKIEDWKDLADPPEYGLTDYLTVADEGIEHFISVMDGGELGAVISLAGQGADENRVYTAPKRVAEDAKALAAELKSQLEESEEANSSAGSEKETLLETINTKYLPIFGSLINCDDWNHAEDIPVSIYYDWYRDYINSVTTHEERIERYKLDFDPNSPGWAYPAEEFESYIQQHFAVSTEYLRENDEVYLADQEVYWLAGGGGNISYRTRVESEEDIQADGELLTIRAACSLLGDFSDTIYKTLVVDTSGEHIRFISCVKEPGQNFKRLEIDVPVIDADMESDMEQSKRLIFFCPPDWESFGGDIDRENKKLVDLICTTPDRTEDRLATIDDKKEVVIGERTFQVFSEEYGILENEPQKQVVPYVIWSYYYFDGELYYRFDFYQNQQTMPVTLDEFEEVLATMEIHDVEG